MQSQVLAEERPEDEVVEELKKIEVLLTPTAAPKAGKGMKNEFLFFLQQYKVLGLAVAFIIGVYLGAVVLALVKDLIMPVIGLALPGIGNLASYRATLNGQIFDVGDFAVSVITFAIVALGFLLIVKVATRWGMSSKFLFATFMFF